MHCILEGGVTFTISSTCGVLGCHFHEHHDGTLGLGLGLLSNCLGFERWGGLVTLLELLGFGVILPPSQRSIGSTSLLLLILRLLLLLVMVRIIASITLVPLISVISLVVSVKLWSAVSVGVCTYRVLSSI